MIDAYWVGTLVLWSVAAGIIALMFRWADARLQAAAAERERRTDELFARLDAERAERDAAFERKMREREEASRRYVDELIARMESGDVGEDELAEEEPAASQGA